MTKATEEQGYFAQRAGFMAAVHEIEVERCIAAQKQAGDSAIKLARAQRRLTYELRISSQTLGAYARFCDAYARAGILLIRLLEETTLYSRRWLWPWAGALLTLAVAVVAVLNG
jgi:hypothetical protein